MKIAKKSNHLLLESIIIRGNTRKLSRYSFGKTYPSNGIGGGIKVLFKLLKIVRDMGINVANINAADLWCPYLFNIGVDKIINEVTRPIGSKARLSINTNDTFIKNTIQKVMYANWFVRIALRALTMLKVLPTPIVDSFVQIFFISQSSIRIKFQLFVWFQFLFCFRILKLYKYGV